ncbi:hypothetical protein BWI17_15035 [Betaproteobacteria bacterium GR16-43]|nr:hypothetical protein BWI17_15035 [Betaproteobacteria bacterium GR16-43]
MKSEQNGPLPMKTAQRNSPARTAAPGARAAARVRDDAPERSIVSLELRAMEDLNRLTSRVIAAAARHARTPRAEGSRDDYGALLAHQLPLMERQLEHMARLFDDLADIARLGEGQMEITRDRMRLSALVAAAVDQARPALEEGRHEIEVSIPEAPLYVDGDLARLAQALGTLLTHGAWRSVREGVIHIAATLDNAEVVITVRDDAPVPPRPPVISVFGIFPTVEADYGLGASGLCIGLALVKGLVELHGGSVMAESLGPGLGTSYEVRLPALPA